MLNMRTYTREELKEIFHTDRIDSIKSKLNRQGYTYEASGRGQELILTITGLPPRFKTFCIEQLGFAPQTDFERLKVFLYRFFLMMITDNYLLLQCQDCLKISFIFHIRH